MPKYGLKIGYSLHYFEGDYAGAINGNNTFLAAQPMNSGVKQNSFDLFNGNIATMVTTITNPNTRVVIPLGNAYKYDQLNRLKEARSYNNIDLSGNTWNSGGTQLYYNAFDYDANGNIIHQVRFDDANHEIDNMSYYYEDQNGTPDSKYVNPAMKVKRNRLRYVKDDFDYDGNDIDPGMSNTNYGYDAEGRLTSDVQERIDRITWRVDGKVRKIEHTPGSAKKNLIFDYDALGHRIAKHVYSSNNVWEKSTYYVLDAQGNTMAVYQHANDDVNHVITFAQTEKHIYGSSRLGINNKQVSMFGSQNATYSMRSIAHFIGKRTYELSNHLGNVLSVISDKVIPHNNGGTVDYWLADIRQAMDYSPFGVILKNRDISLTSGTGGVPYRYGFNGMEKDDELKGNGNSYDFGARMHDPRLGRFLSLDNYAKEFPHESPYGYAGNSPILYIDRNGDFKIVITEAAKKALGGTALDTKRFEEIVNDLANYLVQNEGVVKTLMEQTGFTKEQIMEYAKSGSGPTIFLTVNNEGAQGALDHVDLTTSKVTAKDGFEIDYTIIQNLATSKDPTDKDKAARNLFIGALVLHEFTHWGDRKNNNGNITGQSNADGVTYDASGKPIIPKGKQGVISKYNHRGLDIDMKMLRTAAPFEDDLVIDPETRERISGGFFPSADNLKTIVRNCTLTRDGMVQNGSSQSRGLNVLPKDQKP